MHFTRIIKFISIVKPLINMVNPTKYLHRKNIINFNKANRFYKSILFITSVDYQHCEFVDILIKMNVFIIFLDREDCESFTSFTKAIKTFYDSKKEKISMIIFGCDHGDEIEPVVFFDSHHFHRDMRKKGKFFPSNSLLFNYIAPYS